MCTFHCTEWGDFKALLVPVQLFGMAHFVRLSRINLPETAQCRKLTIRPNWLLTFTSTVDIGQHAGLCAGTYTTRHERTLSVAGRCLRLWVRRFWPWDFRKCPSGIYSYLSGNFQNVKKLDLTRCLSDTLNGRMVVAECRQPQQNQSTLKAIQLSLQLSVVFNALVEQVSTTGDKALFCGILAIFQIVILSAILIFTYTAHISYSLLNNR